MLALLGSIFGSASFVAAVGWVVSIGNRVTRVETQIEDLPVLIEKQFDAVNKRLERIERGMNGALKHVEV